MKISRPRTGSSSRTEISPSGNRSTAHAPSWTPTSRATLAARRLLAVPVKIVNSFAIGHLPSARRLFSQWIVSAFRGRARARLRLQMLSEPLRRQTRHLFERARFFKEVRRARNDLHLFFAAKAREGLPIQFNDRLVVGADDQQRRRFH